MRIRVCGCRTVQQIKSTKLFPPCGPWHSLKVAQFLRLRSACELCCYLFVPLCNDFLHLQLLFFFVFFRLLLRFLFIFIDLTSGLYTVVVVAVCSVCVCVCVAHIHWQARAHTQTHQHVPYTDARQHQYLEALATSPMSRAIWKKRKEKKTKKKWKETTKNKKFI